MCMHAWMVDKLKQERKPILEEIEELQKQIEDLRKGVEALESYVGWTSTFVEKLLDVVGIPKHHQTS